MTCHLQLVHAHAYCIMLGQQIKILFSSQHPSLSNIIQYKSQKFEQGENNLLVTPFEKMNMFSNDLFMKYYQKSWHYAYKCLCMCVCVININNDEWK